MRKYAIMVTVLIAGIANAQYNWKQEALHLFPTKAEVDSDISTAVTDAVDTNLVISTSSETAPSSAAVKANLDAKLPAAFITADTNDVTVVTAYTPGAAGYLLTGKLAADTNAVWIASGLTTNDWVQIVPAP